MRHSSKRELPRSGIVSKIRQVRGKTSHSESHGWPCDVIPICRWKNSKSIRRRKKGKKNHNIIHFKSGCSTLKCHQTSISLHSRLIVLWYHLFPRSLEHSAVPDLFQYKPWWLQGFWSLHKCIYGQDWNWHCFLDVEVPTYCCSLYHRSWVCGSMQSRQRNCLDAQTAIGDRLWVEWIFDTPHGQPISNSGSETSRASWQDKASQSTLVLAMRYCW